MCATLRSAWHHLEQLARSLRQRSVRQQQHPPNGAASIPAVTRTRTRTQLGTRRRTQLADSGGIWNHSKWGTRNETRSRRALIAGRCPNEPEPSWQPINTQPSTMRAESKPVERVCCACVCARICVWWCLAYAAVSVAAHKRVSFHIHAVIRELAMSAGSSQLAVYAVAS